QMWKSSLPEPQLVVKMIRYLLLLLAAGGLVACSSQNVATEAETVQTQSPTTSIDDPPLGNDHYFDSTVKEIWMKGVHTVGMNSVDTRAADVMEYYVRGALGDRYVELWYAERNKGILLGVFDLENADQAFISELEALPKLNVVDCPVSIAELDATIDELNKATRLYSTSIGHTRCEGRITVEVLEGLHMDEVISAVQAVDGLQVVTGEPPYPPSGPGNIVVVISPYEIIRPD
ncbi:MAG: hypothetical protein FWG16_03315, partial [Micrococcales bacterium]|nr:hypothetical protein [Micrococcales bacterium]